MSKITVAISTFNRPDTVIETVSNLRNIPNLINVNDSDKTLAKELKDKGLRVVAAKEPQLFWQGMSTLIKESRTEWLLISSDEDSVIVEELPDLEKFAIEKKAGVVACPVYNRGLVKPWPSSWADRLTVDEPLGPSSFHDISGYISGTLIHRESALKYLPYIERLAPENE